MLEVTAQSYLNLGEQSRQLQVVSVRDALRAEVREQILSGARAPGTKVVEEELARLYQVARPTARQIIQDLVFEGLLRRRPNRSAEVPVLTPDDVGEIYEIRTLVESAAIRGLAERREVPDEMVRRVRALESLPATATTPSDEEWAAIVEHDQAFHAALVQTVENRRLMRMYALVQAENRLCLAQERNAYADAGGVAREHRTLLDSIATEAPARVVELLHVHLDEARRRLIALADKAPDTRG